MNVNLTRRCLSMLLVLVMLFTMMPTTIIAEETHDHSHEEAISLVEVEALAISASASANYVYAGEEAVAVTTKISGGMAPYEVKLQAVKNGSVVFTDSKTTDSTSVKLSYAPASWGEYELVVTVHDALHNQELTSVALAVAEHDTENAADWAASVSGASVSSDWGKSLVSVAKTQIGYKESEKDFVIKSGEKQGYSRYGAWFGTPYTGWNNAFLAFVAEYAKVPNDALLSGSSYRSWVNGMNAKGAYMKGDYTPKAGDIAFLSGSRVGLVESVSGANVTVIEGDVNGAVARKTYAISKVAAFGNTGLMQGLHNGTATAVPTAAPDVTKAPEGGDVPVVTAAPAATPVATPVPEEEELIFQATPTPRPGVTAAPKEDRDPLQNLGDTMDQLIGELDAVATAVPMQFSEAYYLMQAEVRALLEKYMGTATPTKAEVEAFVEGLELQELYYIIMEFDELVEYAKSIGLSDYEYLAVLEVEDTASAFAGAVEERFDLLTKKRAVAYPIANCISISDGSMSGNVYQYICSAKWTSSANKTLTLTNISANKATIKFDYSCAIDDGTGTITINGTSMSTAGGSYEITLDAGASISIVLTIKKSGIMGANNILTMQNFSFKEIKTSAQVTIDGDTSLGSVADSAGVNVVGTTVTVPEAGYTVVATPVSGAIFYGWINPETKEVLGTTATYTIYPTADMTIKAVFLSANAPAHFLVGGLYLYDNLADADTAAKSCEKRVIALVNNATLPAGDYTISAGNTLLIPYNDANLVHTTQPNVHSGYVAPSVYRTLTMASGANLTINGALSVGGSNFAGGNPAGGVSGPYGHIKMESDSKITLESGANLYAWGYITGSGSVHAKSGSAVYEDFQVNDWRGGSASLGMVKNDHRVFLFSQYYIQNVEVPLRLDAGASEYGCMSVAISGNIITERVLFVGSGEAMFTLKNGYVTKDYLESSGRLEIKLNGDVEMNGISMTLKVIVTYNINSKDYELPINGNMTLDVASGSITVSQNLVLQPGAEIIVREGASCILKAATQMYVFDHDDWGNYCHSVSVPYSNLPYPPSAKNVLYRDRDAIVQIDGKIVLADGVTNSNVYTTAHKASIISTGSGEITVAIGNKTTTAQATQSNTTVTYKTDIPVTNAKLKNADGSYIGVDATVYTLIGDSMDPITPSAGETVTFVYNAELGKWFWPCDLSLDTHYYNMYEVSANCTQGGGKTYICSCGNQYDEVTEPLGHQYAVTGYETDATEYCLDRTCTREGCGYVKPAGAEHQYAVAYTCADKDCTVCGTTLTGDGVHSYTDKSEVVPPTCTVDGYTRKYCACGAYVDEDPVPAAHDYKVTAFVNAVENEDGEWAWAWTGAADAVDCNAAGSVTYTCSVCEEGTEGKSYTVTIAAPGHDWDGGVVTPAKCNADGYTTYTCKRCNVEENRDFVTTRPDHDYTGSEPTVVAPTCIHEGYTYTVCKNCGYENKYDLQPATGVHPFKITLDDQVEAVQNEDGTISYKTVTCTVDGTVTYTCTTPGCTEANHTDTIKAPGHSEAIDKEIPATCVMAGKTEGKHCSVCNEILLAQKPIDKLEHNYITDEEASYPATCTAAGLTVTICTNGCGSREEKEVPILDHTYTEKVSETPATCYSTGLIVWKCSNCTATKDETLNKLPHYYGENGYTSKTEPTCKEPGYIIYDCQNDGCTVATKEEDPDNANTVACNQRTVVPGKAPTCLETGLTDGATCSWCGSVSKVQKPIPALDHYVETWNVDVKATCQNAGQESGVCTRDNCGVTVTRVIEQLTHEGYEYKHFDAVEATCIADGHSKYDYCELCDIEIGKTVYPKGDDDVYHDYQNVAKDATCTEPGLTEAYQCTRCGAWKDGKEAEEIPAGHTIVKVDAQAKTCTEDGWNAYEYCSVCGDAEAAKQAALIPAGHTIVKVEAQAKTCTEDGWNAYEYCSVCGDAEAAKQAALIPAGHTIVKVEAQAKTCTEDGWNAYEYCSVCGDAEAAKQAALIPASHELTHVEAKAATCTEKGWEAYDYCTVDGCGYTTYKEIDPFHQKVVKITEQVDPTCQDVGHYVDADYCEACKTWLDEIQIPKVDHKYEGNVLEHVEPTCYAEGYTITQCVWCTESKTTATTAKVAHAYDAGVGAGMRLVDGAWVREDCKVGGTVTYTCTVAECPETEDGHTKVDTYEALADHSGSWTETLAATCQTEGSQERTCELCQKYETAVIEKLTHTEANAYTEYEEKKATCMEAGYSAYKHCNICNLDIGKTDYPIDTVNGHDYQPVAGKEAGCETTGLEKAMQCIYCSKWQDMEGNDIAEQPVIPTIHSGIEGIADAIPVTCYQDGHSAGSKYCPDCGKWFEGETTPKAAHDVKQFAHEDATCTADGFTTMQCVWYDGVKCTETETTPIPKLGHEWERAGAETKWVETKPATCYEAGVLTWICECSETTTDEIPMIQHTYNNGVPGKESTKWNAETGEWENCVETDTVVYTCQNAGCTAENSETHTYTVDIAVTEHAWVYDAQDEPTCTEPGTASGKHCSRCGLEEGGGEIPAKGHTWDSGVGTGAKWDDEAQKWVTTSCTEDGSVLYTCTLCQVGEYTKTVTVTAPGHDWDEGTVAVEATCIKGGSTTYKCTACDAEETRNDIPATGIHDQKELVPGKDATCTESGLTDGYNCSMCGAEQVKQDVIPAIHDTIEGIEEAIDSDCTTPGHDVGSKYCDECGEWFVDNVIEVKDHDYTVLVKSVAATCDADAYEVKQCTWYDKCGKEETFTKENTKLGHAWKVKTTDGVVADGEGWKLLDCTVAGSVSYVCENDASHTDTKTIDATGHQHTEVIPGQEVTCLEDGYKDGLKCSDCGKVITERELIKANGEHTWGDWATTTEPKCGVKGEERRDCELCDAYETNELAALEHDYEWEGGKVITPVTCTTDGYTTLVCKACGDETVDPDSIVAHQGHKERLVPVVPATCGAVGYTAGVQCTVCETWTTPRTELPKLEHEYDEGVITIEPDCENAGVKTFTCTQPGCTADIEGHSYTEEVKANGHKPEDVPEVKVTCTTDGCTAGTKCSVCGDILSGCVVIVHEGHKEETIPAVEVSCTQDGYTAGVKCSVCEEVLEAPVLTEKAHHLDLIQVEAQAPECEKIGWDAYEYCTKCDYTTYNELPALEHKKVTVKGYAETCTEAGLTDGEQCELCEKWFVEQKKIPAAHKPVDVPAVDVTCTTDGCTAGKKCSVCGDILEGCEPIEHEGHKEETLEAKDPTCTATGLTAGKKCTVCGEITVKQETVDMLKHNHTQLPAVAPTCEEDGLTEGDWCDMCGHYWIKQQVDPATGHNIVIDEAVEATCTKTGLTKGEHCTKCNDKTIAQEVVPMKAHTEVEIPAVAATCLVDGKTAGKKCSVCGTVTEEPTVVPAPGHKPVEIPAEAPTCTEPGKTAGEKCSVCGLVLKAQSEDPATGHTNETIPAVEATCTTAGKTAGVKCSVCNTVLTKPEDIPAQGHKLKTIEGYDATCTVDGLSDGVQCEVCEIWTTEQTVITAPGHKPVKVPAKAPTCLETGLTEGSYCSACKEELVKQDVVPATGHTPVVDPAVAPTCTKDGLTEGKHCANCPEILQAQEVIPATNHANKAPGEAKAATCTEAGNTAGVYCPDCKTWLEDQKTINPTGHTPVIDKMVPATCTETGLTEGKHCANCPEILQAQEVIPAINHANKVPGEAKAATCTADGNTAGVYCPDCKTWLEEQEVIPAINHANKAPGEKKEPTCTEVGNTAGVYCPDCETWLEKQEEIPATGHKMDEGQVTTDYTCTTAGVKTYTCLNGCGHTTTEDLPAMHRPEVVPGKAPTCTEPGLTEGSVCSACGENLVKQETIEASHTWETVKINAEATCTTDGSKDVRCTVEGCGATDTLVIPATGHTEVIDPAKAATCEEDGLTAGKHCSVCNEVLVAQKVIAGGHRWSKAPCTELGATCSRCKQTNTELFEHAMTTVTCTEDSVCKYGCGLIGEKAPGHTVVEIEEIPPLCGEPGWTVGTMCSVCGAIIEEPKIVPALEHQIVQYPAKKATFTSAGWEAYEACDFCAYTTKVEIPALGEQTISSYSEFMKYLPYLEEFAVAYAKNNPGTDPVALVIKYIRTGVDRYNSGSWGIMAGYENAGFAKYVGEQEDILNADIENIDDMYKISGLKNLDNFKLPNGNLTDIGHMFGTMDITYHNYGSVNHADVGGWAGDLVDLLSTADHTDHTDVIASAGGDFETLVDVIRFELLGHGFNHGDVFSQTDIYGDLDAFYVMDNLDPEHYNAGDMTALFDSYFTTSLDDKFRAGYLLENRLDGVSTRSAVREAVYTAYTSNNVINTLEGTRDFNGTDLHELRQAVCYAFADYLCALAGDYVDVTENPYLNVFQSSYSSLAPGIKMETHYAKSADDKQMVYYLAYADVGREDVDILASYESRYPEKWGMARVIDQANFVQDMYGEPESERYIENFNVIVGINGSGYNMQTGEPSGLLIMHGQQYHPIDHNGFFGILNNGRAVIGTTDEYNGIYKGQVREAIAGFGTMLVKDGEIAITAESDYYSNRASRTAVGITATGRVVFMVLDGRQEPRSCGGSMIEIAQIMRNAGCVQAINLDGGGSTTFVAREAGSEELAVCNNPSDGISRSVSTALMMVSTAPSSTAFDHALVKSQYSNLTMGASVQMEATGVSATGNVVELPEGTTWAVSDETKGIITEDGIFTALDSEGTVEVQLLLGETILGQKTLNLVIPDQLYFTKDKIDSVYGSSVELPLKASFEGKDVAFTADDIVFTLSTNDAGEMNGLSFVAVAESKITTVNVVAALKANDEINAAIDVILYKQGENSFDFDQATGGSRILAWQREVSNSYTADNSIYYIVNPDEKMVTSYAIALDMTQIPIPERLEDLTYMLPGSDIEGACAWTFLLQLAERISVLTTVKPRITFDPNFDVDYSEIKLINDYFTLDATEFDEATNTLTLTLHWIDQTAAIPAETANPLCMVTGLKVTPKDDAAWNDKDQLKPVHSGDVSYKIYMRASGLYSFSQKPENQEIFGLYPFVNPNLESEKGGYFQDTYTEFEDSYTLVRTLKNGWYNEDGGFVYYVNGVRNTGVQEVEGLYYDFGDNGVNAGKKTYTGLHVMDGYTYYIQLGAITTGWNMINGVWYYFDSTGKGVNGTRGNGVEGVTFEFKDGKLLHGCWLEDEKGRQYYYGPEHYYGGWKSIDGEDYFFEKYYVLTGVVPVHESHDLVDYWYELDETTGKKIGLAKDGFYEYDGEIFFVQGGLSDQTGLIYFEGHYYYLRWNSSPVRNKTDWVTEDNLNGLPLTAGAYRFDEKGRILMDEAISEENGSLYYYKDGPRVDSAGVVKVDGYYYYVSGGGKVRTSVVYDISSSKTNGLISAGTYRIDEKGHILMDTAIAPNKDGKLAYYQEGPLTKNAGLVMVDGAYYFVNSNGTVATDTSLYVSKTNGLLPKATYTFGADGKLILERMPGDADGNNAVNLSDALLVMDYGAGSDVLINLSNADVNADGKADINDGLLIMQYVSCWDVTLK